ncbi:AAA family ATPase [Flavitalea antarctica]
MQIILKQLSITNFKGIKRLELEFNESITSLFGRNGSGKTTIFDAFSWLLFSKDSNDRTDFEIKPLSIEGIRSQKTENEVQAVLQVDGRTITLKRIHREKWEKKRGEPEERFTGNEKVHFVNDVPVSETEFRVKVAGIVEERLFKMLTNPLYFNTSLKWQERREVLMKMAGDISDTDILDMLVTDENKEYWTEIAAALTSGDTIDEIKKRTAAKRKKAVEEIKFIPTRIDEINRSIPEYQDYEEIEHRISEKQEQITALDNSLSSKSQELKTANDLQSGKVKEIQGLQHEIRVNENLIRNKFKDGQQNRVNTIRSIERKISDMQQDHAGLCSQVTSAEKKVSALTLANDNLRKKWSAIDAEQINFDDHATSCPVCKRAFDAEVIESRQEELTKEFNKNKSDRLAQLSADGKQNKAEIAGFQQQIELKTAAAEKVLADIRVLQEELADLKKRHEDSIINEEIQVEALLADDAILEEMKGTVLRLQSELESSEKTDTSFLDELKKKKSLITAEIDELKRSLQEKSTRERSLKRIDELQTEEANLANVISDHERTEYNISLFEKAKIDTMQARINHKFTVVTFKMFNTLVNGAVEPCCECLIKGVPFSDANTASKLNAGIDVINALCEHYNTNAPIFIDGRESVTDIIDTSSQIINLVVSEKDKKIRIVSNREMATA